MKEKLRTDQELDPMENIKDYINLTSKEEILEKSLYGKLVSEVS